MPYASPAQRRFMHAKHPDIAARWDKEMRKKKVKVVVNNKMKGSLGATSFAKGRPTKVEINIKKHKGDKAELASTVKHELMHVKNPKMTEREVYKRTAKTKIPPDEQRKLLAKVRMKGFNYKMGATKRKLKIGRVKTAPGELISKAKSMSRRERVSVMGMV